MRTYVIAGYIDCDAIATGFLIPIYESEGEFFFHKLSDNLHSIISFTPYIKEHYEHEKYFKRIENGSKKTIGAPSFFVFKYRNKVYAGSCDEESFITQMKEFEQNSAGKNIASEIRKLF